MDFKRHKKIWCGVLVLVIIVVSVSAYWTFVKQSNEAASTSTVSTISTGPPLQESDFFFNYSKCRSEYVIYINFYVRNQRNETVHYLNSSVTWLTIGFSNGTVINSNQVHVDAKLFVGALGQWHIGIPVTGFWPNNTSIVSVKLTFTVFVRELDRTLSWTVLVPVSKTDRACPTR